MPTVQQIKGNLFSISGSTKKSPYGIKSDSLLLPGTDEICEWKIITEDERDVIGLEVAFRQSYSTKFTSSSTVIKAESTSVRASYQGVWKEMTCIDAKWRTSWNMLSGLCDVCRNKNETLIVFEILIDPNKHSCQEPKQEKQTPRQTSVVLSHLSNLWKNKSLADVTFNCDGEKIQAHTLIVSSGSPVLNALFQTDFKEKKERVVEITDVKFDVMEQLLRYIYTGKADFKKVDAGQLLAAADKYAVHSLKEDCIEYLSKHISLKNAVSNLVAAHLYGSPNLLENVMQFMSKNAEAICVRQDWMDLLLNYPRLGYLAVQRMIINESSQSL